MNDKEKDHEYESLSRPACECGTKQREQPSGNLRVSAVAVWTALYQLARFEARHLLERAELPDARSE